MKKAIAKILPVVLCTVLFLNIQGLETVRASGECTVYPTGGYAVNLKAGETLTLTLSLTDIKHVAAIQFRIRLPQGLSAHAEKAGVLAAMDSKSPENFPFIHMSSISYQNNNGTQEVWFTGLCLENIPLAPYGPVFAVITLQADRDIRGGRIVAFSAEFCEVLDEPVEGRPSDTIDCTVTMANQTLPSADISAGEATSSGGAVDIPVSIANNPGWSTLEIEVGYEPSLFTFDVQSVQAGTAIPEGGTFSAASSGSGRFTVKASAPSDVSGNGTLFTFTLTPKAGAGGKSSVTVGDPNGGTRNANGEPLTLRCHDGSITLPGAAAPTTSTKKTTTTAQKPTTTTQRPTSTTVKTTSTTKRATTVTAKPTSTTKKPTTSTKPTTTTQTPTVTTAKPTTAQPTTTTAKPTTTLAPPSSTVPSTTHAAEEPGGQPPADLTGDGKSDIRDAMTIYLFTVGQPDEPFTEAQRALADVNRDGEVDIFDALSYYVAVSGKTR